MKSIVEVWKDVDGFEGYYEVSSEGRVRSVDRLISYAMRGGTTSRVLSGKVLKPKVNRDGYECYSLSINGKSYDLTGHRLTAQAFIPNPDNLPMVNHIDNISNNNIVGNLEWATNSSNQRHAFGGNFVEGLDGCLSRLVWEDFQEILRLYREGSSYREITDIFNLTCNPNQLSHVLSGDRHSEVSGFTANMTTKGSKYTEVDIHNLHALYFIGDFTVPQLSKAYNINRTYLYKLFTGTKRPKLLTKFKDYLLTNNIESKMDLTRGT